MEKTRCTGSGPRTITTRLPCALRPLVGGHETAQPGRVEEHELREVEDEERRIVRLDAAQLLLELGRGRQVELAPEGDVHESVAVLGVQVKDLHRPGR